MTLVLFSGGPSLAVKAEAVEKPDYMSDVKFA